MFKINIPFLGWNFLSSSYILLESGILDYDKTKKTNALINNVEEVNLDNA